MSTIEPSADAHFFVIDSGAKQYDAFLDIVKFGEYYYGQVRYRPIGTLGKWVFLSPTQGSSPTDSEFDLGRMTTMADTDREIDSVIANINASIETRFGGDSEEMPKSGIARALYMLRNNMFEEKGNVIIRMES